MDDLNELGAVVGIDLSEQTTREYTQLKKYGDCLVLGFALFEINKLVHCKIMKEFEAYFEETRGPFLFRIWLARAARDPFVCSLPRATYPS